MKLFRNLKIKQKLTLFSCFFILALAVSTTLSIFLSRRLSSDTEKLAQVELPAVRKMTLVDMMHDGLRAVVFSAHYAATLNSKEKMSAATDELSEFSTNIITYLDELKTLNLSSDLKLSIANVNPEVIKYTELAKQLVQYASEKNLAAYKHSMPEFEQQFATLEDKLGKIGEQIMTSSEKIQTQSLKTIAFVDISLISLCGFVIFFGILSSIFFIRNIDSRLQPIIAMVNSIEQENYKLEFSDTSTDELSFLGQCIKKMAINLEQQINNIKATLQEAQQAKIIAENASLEALTEKNKSLEAKKEADVSKEQALAAMNEAETSQAQAVKAKSEAEFSQANAVKAMKEAELSKEQAIKAKLEAEHNQKNAADERQKALVLLENQKKSDAVLKLKIDEILLGLNAAAAGDFSIRLSVQDNEPIDVLGLHLNDFFKKMEFSLQQIDDVSNQLNLSIHRIVNLNKELSISSENTKISSANALLSSNKSKKESSDLSAQANEIKITAKDIFAAAETSTQSSIQVLNKAKEADSIIHTLSEATKEINDFTKVISTISSQTNLLALNATIEASRAGDAGKGFSVVANEVKQLAQLTNHAAEQVQQHIDRILSVADNMVTSINEITHFSDQTKTQSESVYNYVSAQSKSTEVMFNLISKNIDNLENINANILTVQTVTEKNSNSVENINEQSHLMSSLSQKLNDVVGQFRGRHEVKKVNPLTAVKAS